MKAVNIILGIGTAIIVSALIVLGIHAFYPAPVYPTYPESIPAAPIPCGVNTGVTCTPAQQKTLDQQNAQQQAQQDAYNQAQTDYQTQIGIYDRNLFIIANVIGVIVFALGFWLLFGTAIVAQSVPVGIMIAGLYSVIYGYAEGWGSVDDKLKFLIGLLLAVVMIGGAMWLIQRAHAKAKH
jgi:hypothetical protein